MGNCHVSASTGITPKIRVVQASEGRVVDVDLPTLQSSMKVGELMLEFPPGCFVTQLNKADLKLASTGKRAAPLGADADAKPGNLYVLFPMPRLHTRISSQELLSVAKLLHLHDLQLIKAACEPPKVNVPGCFTSSARVAPLVEEECKDVNVEQGADTYAQACPLPATFRMQQREQDQAMSYPDSSSCIAGPCHGDMGMMKPKPWAPRLQTIMEAS